MIAVLHQRQRRRVAAEALHQRERMRKRHVFVPHALQHRGWRAGANHAAEQKVLAPVLDQIPGEAIGLARIGGGPSPHAFIHDRAPRLVRRLGPDERFGEVDRRRDENEAFDALRLAGLAERPGGEQRQISAHGRTDQNLRSLAFGPQERQRLLEPAGDRPILEPPVGSPMAGIVEPQQAETPPLGFRVERASPWSSPCRSDNR